MCGIAGVVGITPGDDEVRAVRRMLDAQRHRGPEAQRVRGAGRALFGQCALEFVDIGRSWQPYLTASGRYLVVFNGEIYNHGDLRARLRHVLPDRDIPPGEAALIAEWFAVAGLAIVPELEGMFAIAVYDAERDETTLIRDRFGKKPLCYAPTADGVIFASELRAAATHPRCSRELSRCAIGPYLTFGAVPAPFTLLDGVWKVHAGSAVTIGRSGRRVHRCLPICFAPTRTDTDPGQLLATLDKAVAARIPTEVPCGVFLSGGLDSSMVAALAVRHGGPMPTFSIGFEDAPSFDETPQARAVAAHLGTGHTVVSVTRGALAMEAPRVLESIDEPVTDQSLLATTLLARAARARVKVVLTGDGADELFMGYNFFPVSRLMDMALRGVPRRALRGSLRWLGNRPTRETNLHYAHIAAHLARTVDVPPERRFFVGGGAFERSSWPAVLDPQTWEAVRSIDEFEQLGEFMAKQPTLGPSERLQAGMIRHFLCDVILAKVDRATMGESLEARCPFLDSAVAAAALASCRRAKLRGFQTKRILRDCARSLLPADIVRGVKRGFRSPTAALLRRELKTYMTDVLASHTVRCHRIWRPEVVDTLVREHISGERDHHRALWSLTCLGAWLLSLRRAA